MGRHAPVETAAQPVDVYKRQAQGRSEIAVAAAAHSGAFYMLSQLFCRLLGQGEGLLVGRGEFQGRAADAAGDLQGDARPGGLQALDDAVDPLGLRQGPGAHIHFHLGPLCHDVGPGAALGHAHIDCGALVVVGQRMEEQGLLGHLLHCTDAALGVIACVGGFATDGDGVFARAFPGFLQVACHRLCRFGTQHLSLIHILYVPLQDLVLIAENATSTGLCLAVQPRQACTPVLADIRRVGIRDAAVDAQTNNNMTIAGRVVLDDFAPAMSQEMEWLWSRQQDPASKRWTMCEVRLFASHNGARVSLSVDWLHTGVTFDPPAASAAQE